MENIITYRVKILSPNGILIFRGKKLRTPVECHNVFHHEIDVIKSQMLKDSLKYEIVRENEIKKKEKEPLIIEKRDEEVKVEELYIKEVEPNSIMDRLLGEEKANKK